MSGNLTDYAEDLLARALCGLGVSLPTQLFVALGTGGGDAADPGNGTPAGVLGEPVGNGYARQRVTFIGAGTGTLRNAAEITFTFTAAPTPFGTLTHAGLHDAASGGNALTHAPLAAAVQLTGAGSIVIAAGALTVSGD